MSNAPFAFLTNISLTIQYLEEIILYVLLRQHVGSEAIGVYYLAAGMASIIFIFI